MARLEVALLVEHAVVRQKHLVVDGLDLAVVQKRRGIEDIAGLVDEPHDGRDALRGAGDDVELREVVAHKRWLEHEVLRRVAGDHELGEADDVHTGVAGALDPVDDQPCIAGQVADRGVDLCERDPHKLILPTIA